MPSKSKINLAQYIDTGSDRPRDTKQEPHVALTRAVEPVYESPYAGLDAKSFVIDESAKYAAHGHRSARNLCWQACFQDFWVRGEYLYWWTDAMDTPPLVTTSNAGTPPNLAGVLGQPGTQTLLGSGDLGGSGQSGARISFGWWMDPAQCNGFEASYFGLGNQTSSFTASSANTPILARPVFDMGTNAEAAMLAAYPGILTGAINVDASTKLQGVEALYRRRVSEGCDSRVDFLFGYRYASLDEGLRINQASEWTSAQGAIVVGTTQNLFDSFTTNNDFHGGEFGISYTHQTSCWSLETVMKMAMGNNHSEVVIDGQTVNTVPNGGSATFVGGLLAQQTNIGRYERDAFGFIPELNITARRELGCNLHMSVGYNLMYWTAILRPGDQIDRNVSQFPPEAPTGVQRPAFAFQSQSVLIQGIQLGLEYRF
ncbi:MAG: BBP7 family outer membrane beta-barrel protein [Planctomycetales bacterium]|nr:BBP7 family outer membrane beta-barrel protein [Planctomycetales bacterium]